MSITWTCKKFGELTPHELYAALRLRSEVFVVEQNCVFLDLDDKDDVSWHVFGWHNELLAAYTRLVPAGTSFPENSIGRVVTSPKMRKSGAGKILMQKSIDTCYTIFGKTPIRIGAQLYLKHFYESFGFQQSSEVYIEDGIDHIEMLLTV
jgi:ElaA protein